VHCYGFLSDIREGIAHIQVLLVILQGKNRGIAWEEPMVNLWRQIFNPSVTLNILKMPQCVATQDGY
jgi:hypothetical protein